MGDLAEVTLGDRGKAPDGDVLGPRTEIVHGPEGQVVPSRAVARAPRASSLPSRPSARSSAIGSSGSTAAAWSSTSTSTTGRPRRILGGYYKSRRLVRIYARDRELGQRPLEELFDTFLHELAHHLEYTEPFSFSARGCGRVPGRMHSRLFWRILGELKYRWARVQEQQRYEAQRAQ